MRVLKGLVISINHLYLGDCQVRCRGRTSVSPAGRGAVMSDRTGNPSCGVNAAPREKHRASDSKHKL